MAADGSNGGGAGLLIGPQLWLLRRLAESVVRGVERRAAEQRVEAGHRLGLHRRQRVAVAVEGDGHVLVAEHLGHDLGVRAGRQLQGGEGVAQVMEADRWQLGLPQERPELAGGDVAAPQRVAGVVGEEEVVVGQPVADGQQPLGLVGAMGAQQVDRRVSDGDRALALGGLWVPQPPAPVHPHQGVVDREPAGGPVDVSPAQTEQLALAHAGRQREREERLQRVAARRFEEAACFGGAERTHLRPAPPRQDGACGRVALDESPGDSLIERPVQDGMGVADGGMRAGTGHGVSRAGVVDGRLAGCCELGIRARHVVWAKPGERDAPEGR